MAFELSVEFGNVDLSRLQEQWPRALLSHGIECEIYPKFSVETWKGGFLPFKVLQMPECFIDEPLESPALSGFEVSFKNNASAFFRSARGRTCMEFSLLCLCAAELTKLTSGEMVEAYSGKSYIGAGATDAALAEIKTTIAHPRLAVRKQYPFKEWL